MRILGVETIAQISASGFRRWEKLGGKHHESAIFTNLFPQQKKLYMLRRSPRNTLIPPATYLTLPKGVLKGLQEG